MYISAKINDNYIISTKHTTSKEEAFLSIRSILDEYFMEDFIDEVMAGFVSGKRHFHKFTTPDGCVISAQLLEI